MRSPYRLILLVTCLAAKVVALCASTCAQDAPYRARVINDDTLVHSGPAKVHYATESLQAGDTVDVYRHDPGGWCAIRPPVGSFSMVLAEDIELLSDKFAQVANEGAKCWVGTRLNEVEKPLWQIRLRKGEKLKLLGMVREQYILEEGQPDWIQVTPPKGEFRWVHESNLKFLEPLARKTRPNQRKQSPSQPTLAAPLNAQKDGPERSVLEEFEDSSARIEPATSSQQSRQVPTPASEFDIVDDAAMADSYGNRHRKPSHATASTTMNDGVGGWRKAQSSIGQHLSGSPDGSGFVVQPNSPRSESPTAPNSTMNASQQNSGQEISGVVQLSSSGAQTAQSTIPPLNPNGYSFARIQSLEMRLTEQVVKEPGQWELEPIITECRYVLDNSNDLSERQQAERLLNKALRFREIQTGYQTTGRSWPTTTSQIDSAQLNSNPGMPGQSQLETTYDATGYLNELYRDRGRSRPTYVLQDGNGKILFHIAPAPGLNLHRYLKKEIGVIGQRGFHQQLKLEHVTAERVVELDRIRR